MKSYRYFIFDGSALRCIVERDHQTAREARTEAVRLYLDDSLCDHVEIWQNGQRMENVGLGPNILDGAA